jgi:hypothetical protein
MPYVVKIGDEPNSALDDLKELSRPLRTALLHVMMTELRVDGELDRSDDDEGAINNRWRWRRGITRRDRQALQGVPYEPEAAQPSYAFIIMYRTLTPTEVVEEGGQPGFFVERVLTNAQFATAILRFMDHRQAAEEATRFPEYRFPD